MFSRKKILVVEDNKLNREMLCDILSPVYDILEAENGQKALDILREYGEGLSPYPFGYCHAGHGRITHFSLS
ncbi:MAG: hypothetical protein QM793_02745 [Muricomes sp.]